jgi:predicted acyltransferase
MRFRSIDFFRGLTVAFMLIVNTPGTDSAIFGPLQHAKWHGCTPTDVVFPAFLFVVGVSMFFSFEKNGTTLRRAALLRIGRRAGLIVAIGVLLTWFPFNKSFENLRFFGILQRIGLCYFLAALLVLSLSRRVLVVVAAAILLGYWAVLWWGGMAVFDPLALPTNAVRRLDLWLVGPRHLWSGAGIPFDPEGLLSTLPAVVTVLLGWWSGQTMRRYSLQPMRVVEQLLLWGNILAAVGCVWEWALPINKMLWTSSFVLYAGGLSMLLLAFSVWLIDVQLAGRRGAAVRFFEVFGTNSLVAFVLSGLLIKTLRNVRVGHNTAYRTVYEAVFQPIRPPEVGSLAFAFAAMLLVWGVCWLLWRRGVFLKV